MNRSTEIKLEWRLRKLFNSIYDVTGIVCIVLGVVFLAVVVLSFFF